MTNERNMMVYWCDHNDSINLTHSKINPGT